MYVCARCVRQSVSTTATASSYQPAARHAQARLLKTEAGAIKYGRSPNYAVQSTGRQSRARKRRIGQATEWTQGNHGDDVAARSLHIEAAASHWGVNPEYAGRSKSRQPGMTARDIKRAVAGTEGEHDDNGQADKTNSNINWSIYGPLPAPDSKADQKHGRQRRPRSDETPFREVRRTRVESDLSIRNSQARLALPDDTRIPVDAEIPDEVEGMPDSRLPEQNGGEVESTDLGRRMRLRLKYVRDPFHLAQDVTGTLAKGRFEEALLLTQLASRSVKCTAAWNHLIDFKFKKNQIKSAFKLFNDMKKRQQLPNAQTFTIMFRGYANAEKPQHYVGDGVRIYLNLLQGDRLEPNVKHMNAVMELCARGGDLESMYTIFKSSNETSRAPDRFTYTILLNGLRASTEPLDLSQEQAKTEVMEATPLMKARVIWKEVIERSRQGRLVLDENLVCAMGQMLLTGNKADAREVPELLEMTMGVPRPGSESVPRPEMGSRRSQTGLALAPGQSGPGNKTLSLILQALARSVDTKAVPHYWGYFTSGSPNRVQPDRQNWVDLMRASQRGRASEKATEILIAMPKDMLSPKACRAAMKACQRDTLNQTSFTNAGRVLDHMLSNFEEPDMVTLGMYVDLILTKNLHVRSLEAKGENKQVRKMVGKQVATGLGILAETLKRLEKMLKPASAPIEHDAPSKHDQAFSEQQAILVTLLRKIVGASDLVIKEEVLDARTLLLMRNQRDSINRTVVTFLNKLEEASPGARAEMLRMASRKEVQRSLPKPMAATTKSWSGVEEAAR